MLSSPAHSDKGGGDIGGPRSNMSILHLTPNYEGHARCGPYDRPMAAVWENTPCYIIDNIKGVPIGLPPARKHRAKGHTVGLGTRIEYSLLQTRGPEGMESTPSASGPLA